MAGADRMRRATAGAAAASGRLGMACELSGDAEAAAVSYATAYRLMTGAHRRAGEWYERLRDTTV